MSIAKKRYRYVKNRVGQRKANKLPAASLSGNWGFRRLGAIIRMLWESVWQRGLLLRVSGLTYTTLLAIVPFLAILFAVLKGLGIPQKMEPLMFEWITVCSPETISAILDYIEKVNVASLGTIGLIMMVFTVISVFINLEAAFDEIWENQRPRSFRRRLLDYSVLLLVVPALLFVALSVTALFKSHFLVFWIRTQPGFGPLVLFAYRCLPFIILWMIFTFLFFFMPHSKMRLGPTLLAAIITGTVWQSMQWIYLTFQVKLANYNVLYGTFAQLPMMFIWIFIAWTIALLGAKLAFALQHSGNYYQDENQPRLTGNARQILALAFLREIQVLDIRRQPAWTAEKLAREHGVALRVASRLLEQLIHLRLIKRKGRAHPASVLLPGAKLGRLPVAKILAQIEKLDSAGKARGWQASERQPAQKYALGLMRKMQQAKEQSLRQDYLHRDKKRF